MKQKETEPFVWVIFWAFWAVTAAIGAITCWTAAIWVEGPVCGKLGGTGGILAGLTIGFIICAAAAEG